MTHQRVARRQRSWKCACKLGRVGKLAPQMGVLAGGCANSLPGWILHAIQCMHWMTDSPPPSLFLCLFLTSPPSWLCSTHRRCSVEHRIRQLCMPGRLARSPDRWHRPYGQAFPLPTSRPLVPATGSRRPTRRLRRPMRDRRPLTAGPLKPVRSSARVSPRKQHSKRQRERTRRPPTHPKAPVLLSAPPMRRQSQKRHRARCVSCLVQGRWVRNKHRPWGRRC